MTSQSPLRSTGAGEPSLLVLASPLLSVAGSRNFGPLFLGVVRTKAMVLSRLHLGDLEGLSGRAGVEGWDFVWLFGPSLVLASPSWVKGGSWPDHQSTPSCRRLAWPAWAGRWSHMEKGFSNYWGMIKCPAGACRIAEYWRRGAGCGPGLRGPARPLVAEAGIAEVLAGPYPRCTLASPGATRDIGSALTRMCMRHRSIETKLRQFTK